jgi:hypothetical protein
MKFMASEARQYNMSIGLKNADSILSRVQDEIQFAVNEECAANNECNVYEDFLRTKPVFHIEYTKVKAGESSALGSLSEDVESEINTDSSASAHDAASSEANVASPASPAKSASPASPALPASPAKSETASASNASNLWSWLTGKKDKGTAGVTSAATTATTSTSTASTASKGGFFSTLATSIGSGLSAISSGVNSLLGWNKLGLGSKSKPAKRQESMFKSAMVDTESAAVGKYCTTGNTPNLGPKFSTVIKVEALDGWVRFCDGRIATTRILTADVPQKGRYAGGQIRGSSKAEPESESRENPEQSETAAPLVPAPQEPSHPVPAPQVLAPSEPAPPVLAPQETDLQESDLEEPAPETPAFQAPVDRAPASFKSVAEPPKASPIGEVDRKNNTPGGEEDDD